MTKITQTPLLQTLYGTLGIEMLPEEDGVVRARMPVSAANSQPYGVLAGGATLAFAEIVAGIGSMALIGDDEIPLGTAVSGNHVSSVRTEPNVWVHAYARLIHKGRTQHLWNVDVHNEHGRLVSTVRVTNTIAKDRLRSLKPPKIG